MSLYGFVGNDGVNWWDLLGMARYEYDSDGFHVHAECNGKKLTYAVEFKDDGSVEFRAKNGHDAEFNSAKAKKHFEKVSNCRDELNKMRDITKGAFEHLSDKERVARQGRNLRRMRGVIRNGGRYLPMLMFMTLGGMAQDAQGLVADYLKAVEANNELKIEEAARNIADHVTHDSLKTQLYLGLLDAAENSKPGNCDCIDNDCRVLGE